MVRLARARSSSGSSLDSKHVAPDTKSDEAIAWAMNDEFPPEAFEILYVEPKPDPKDEDWTPDAEDIDQSRYVLPKPLSAPPKTRSAAKSPAAAPADRSQPGSTCPLLPFASFA
jgi:hypothetical protein